MRDLGAVGGFQEVLRYFTPNKGFERLLGSMFDIYVRYGRAFGAVRLARPLPEEEEALSAFFKRDYYNQALIRIGLADFERQMQKVFGSGATLGALLEGYSGRPVLAKTGNRTAKNTDQFTTGLLASLAPTYENTPAGEWFVEMTAHMRRTYRPWVEMYQDEPDAVFEMVTAVAEALNNLPDTGGVLTRLPEFSAKYTGSPYALEFGEMHGQLFLRALANYFGTPIPYTAEDSVNLYVRAGLLAGGVLSRVTVLGLTATTHDGGDDQACVIHNNMEQAHVLTLENLSRFARATAHGNKVFILENPQVYAAVYERLRGEKYTMLCPMGGGTPAFLHLLKLLRESGAVFYYAGNLDYKGLLAADKLYLEFGKSFIPWRYERENYELIIKENEVLLPDEKKGLSMHSETLGDLLSLMRKTGKTASSMPLVPMFIEDIRKQVIV